MEKYQSYKIISEPWIGDIPSHWIKSRVGRHFKIERGRVISKEEIQDNIGDYPVYSSQTSNNGELGRISTYDFEGEYVTWTTDGEKTGTCFHRTGKFNTTNVCGMLSVRESTPFSLKYLNYYLNQVTRPYVRLDINPKLMNNMMSEIPLIIPSIQEQYQIVQFLDKKTELIDKLISTKERKISILKEQRTTLINQVVTKGLNSNVKMKNSGVEWIGEIPKHWKCCNLRYVLELLTDFESNGSFSSVKENVKVDDEGEVWYVRMTDLENNNIRNEKCKYCDLDTYNFLQKTKVYGGELLITKRGEIGKVYLFPYNCGLSTLGPNSYLLRLKNIVNSHFLYFFYISDIGQTTLKLLDNSTTIGSLYKDDIKGSSVIIPPIDEQHQIVEFLGSKTKEIDDIVQLEQKKIDLLKEYRQSLISEVVTGKIKVTTDE